MYYYKRINGKRIKNPLYGVWIGMKYRCYNKNHNYYEYYGGRGITVCEEWINNSMAFMKWAIENGYSRGLQLDRIDNEGMYSPCNCRFVTREINMRNTKRAKFYNYKGEVKKLIEWAEVMNLNYKIIYSRIKIGWSLEKAIETPTRRKKVI